ncbi:MAG: XdhC family protein [Pseudomonadales bacterium]|nr:XdhC family protein [Pseudomonadales bacterium]
MKHSDHTVFNQLNQWLSNKQQAWLVTVLEIWGSAPRPVGSLMACNTKGETVGSISGGCIEEELIEKLQDSQFIDNNSTHPFELTYGDTPEEQDRLQLPCGGQLKLLIEPFLPIQEHQDHCLTILSALSDRASIERQANTQNNQKVAMPTSIQPTLNFQNKSLKHTIGPHSRLLLIGAGPVSLQVAQLALTLDYEVEVCDPRPRYAQQWTNEDVPLTTEMPDDVVRDRYADKYCAVVALAHDPRVDDMGIMEALQSNAFYVGALGSSRTSEKRKSRLLQLDLSESQIECLHAPIGLSIGSRTPAEIAISLMAELTLVKNQLRTHKLASLISEQTL